MSLSWVKLFSKTIFPNTQISAWIHICMQHLSKGTLSPNWPSGIDVFLSRETLLVFQDLSTGAVHRGKELPQQVVPQAWSSLRASQSVPQHYTPSFRD